MVVVRKREKGDEEDDNGWHGGNDDCGDLALFVCEDWLFLFIYLHCYYPYYLD